MITLRWFQEPYHTGTVLKITHNQLGTKLALADIMQAHFQALGLYVIGRSYIVDRLGLVGLFAYLYCFVS